MKLPTKITKALIAKDRRTDQLKRAHLYVPRHKSATAKWLSTAVMPSHCIPLVHRFDNTKFGTYVRNLIREVREVMVVAENAERAKKLDKASKPKKAKKQAAPVRLGRTFTELRAKEQPVPAVTIRVENPVATTNPEPHPKTPSRAQLAQLYPFYYRSLPKSVGTEDVDTYVVALMFPVDDPSGALLHARKKLLLPGGRTGGKEMTKDVIEARDTLNRWLELNA